MDVTTQDQITQQNIPMSSNKMPTPTNSKSSKNTLLIFAVILVLAGIVGITLFLYARNMNSQVAVTPKEAATNPVAKTIPCKFFTSLDAALKTPDAACALDLSGKNLNTLPSEITKLTSLRVINLSSNNFTQLPPQLLEIPTLVAINITSNKLTATPDVSKLPVIQSLILTGNPITNKITPTPGQASSSATNTTGSPSLKIVY